MDREREKRGLYPLTFQQQYQRPVIVQIDLNQATYQAFLNCINSFQGLETQSAMVPYPGVGAVSGMSSHVSIERFRYNLGVLDGLVGEKNESWKGGDYRDEEGFECFKYWSALVKYLKDVGFFKSARRISHL